MEVLWAAGPLSVREVFENIPSEFRPTYELTRSIIYRLISNKIIRKAGQIRNFHVFEAVEDREAIHRRLARSLEDLFRSEIGPIRPDAAGRDRLASRSGLRRIRPAPAGE